MITNGSNINITKLLQKKNNGGLFDLQKEFGNMPRFPWASYPGEKHFYIPKIIKKLANYLDPSSRLDIRLDENNNPQPGEEPINNVDREGFFHDVKYRDAEKLSNPNQVLATKLKADREMLQASERMKPNFFSESVMRKVAQMILKTKLKLGMRIEDELHHRYTEGTRRSIYIPHSFHTLGIDIMFFDEKPILSMINIFTKVASPFILNNRSANSISECIQYVFDESELNPERKLFKYIWSDDALEIKSKLVQSHLQKKM